VDSHFFASLPPIESADSLVNSEVTWLIYPFAKVGNRYRMGDPEIRYSTWEDVLTALREGVAPEPAEILAEIARKKDSLDLVVHTT